MKFLRSSTASRETGSGALLRESTRGEFAKIKMETPTTRLSYQFIESQLGLAVIAFCREQVSFLHFGVSEHALLSALQRTYPDAALVAADEVESKSSRLWVEDLIDHGTANPSFKAEQAGTVFQRTVWNFLCQIPPGTVCTYEDVAKGIGSPRAVRAVASACAHNSIAIAVPCHRVIRKNGGLGGYRWGIERKQSLLENEKRRGLLR